MSNIGLDSVGNWEVNKLETNAASPVSQWGMQYRVGAKMNPQVKKLADELDSMLSKKNQELDNPEVLAKIASVSGHYNSARQAQSSIMKSIKDTAQSIIRNM